MSINYKDVADVLEAVADYVDEIEYTKTAVEKSARHVRVSKLAQQYEGSTGEALPDSLKDKLASLDPETLDHLLKVANNSEDSPESLGGPSDLGTSEPPRTVKEAALQAEDSFLKWIIS